MVETPGRIRSEAWLGFDHPKDGHMEIKPGCATAGTPVVGDACWMRCWLFACVLSAALVAAASAQGIVPRSVWDGVYTEEQAGRGEQLSAEHCARCHGQALEGAEAAPALVGYAFSGNWEGVPLSDLFERVRVSMPLDAPGSLSRQQNLDIVAYLLKVGQFPAGDGELVAQGGALANINFVSYRPQP